MHKKYNKLLCLLITLIIVIIYPINALAQEDLSFELKSKSALLMDYNTGTILYEKNADEKLPIASITKVMTLILALEAIDNGTLKLEDTLEVSEYASSMGGSTVFLSTGEVLPVSTIFKCIIVASANDASVALAEKLAGTIEIFVKNMNEKAKSLGMKNTHFVNCTGLPEDNHYSTARDVSIMSKELLKHSLFFKWSSIWLDELEHKNGKKTSLTNTNRLVRFYNGCDGVKTGFTSEAMHCMSASAKRGNMRLISVVLAAPTSKVRFSEASKLMDYGFATYESISAVKKGQFLNETKDIEISGGKDKKITGVVAQDLSILVKKGSPKNFEYKVDIKSPLQAPIHKDQKIGSVSVKYEGRDIGSVDILSDKTVDSANILDYFNKIFSKWLKLNYE